MTHSYTNPRSGQYLTHAHSTITWAVAAMESCFGLPIVRPHQHGIAIGQKIRLKALCVLRQLHTTRGSKWHTRTPTHGLATGLASTLTHAHSHIIGAVAAFTIDRHSLIKKTHFPYSRKREIRQPNFVFKLCSCTTYSLKVSLRVIDKLNESKLLPDS